MGRRANAQTPNLVKAGANNGYLYAYVQKKVPTKKDPNKLERRKVQLGTLTPDNVFTPNNTFRLMTVEERRALIFPPHWDISAALVLDAGEHKKLESTVIAPPHNTDDSVELQGGENIIVLNEQSENGIEFQYSKSIIDVSVMQLFYSCLIYGNVWLLERIAEEKMVVQDLFEVFHGDVCAVNDVLTLAIYSIVESRSFSRLNRWLDTHKAPTDHRFGSDYITRFTQKISEDHRMWFIQARLKRQPHGAQGSIDSSTRSGYGKCLVNLKYGHNKDRDDLPCTLEVYVYSLTTHEPIYYKRMPGNTSDMVTIRTIISELTALGLKEADLSFISDRGYCSKENMGIFRKAEHPFLMCAKANQAPVISCLTKIEYNKVGLPIGMEYDSETKLYYKQFIADPFMVTLENGEEYWVRDVKVNAFLDTEKRYGDLARVQLAINNEIQRVEAYRSGKTPLPSTDTSRLSLKYHRVRKDKTTGKITFEYNQEAEAKAFASCGFFASCMYGFELNAIEAYNKYIRRDEHEKNFFGLKQDEGADMQDCSSEEGADGRAFIYFVGLILLDTLKYTWKTELKIIAETSRDVLDIMEPIRYSQYLNNGSHMTTFNNHQIKICDAFHITPPAECMTAKAKEDWRREHTPKQPGRKSGSKNKIASEEL